MTFSLVARSPGALMFGMAIASSSPAVASRCAHARSGVGAVATQNITDPALGPKVLRSIAAGACAATALADVLGATPYAAYRQLLAVGSTGAPAAHSGSRALGIAGVALGGDAAAAGNLLASQDVPQAMVAAFEGASGHFGARLLEGLDAGARTGGEAGPVHSAGLLVVRDVSWPIIDLRIDWCATDPIAALIALWGIYAPQIEDYVRRAQNPADAPSFGVPGNT
jgi:uncharacterized Ntn-hydrolase superfamily protein